MINERVKYISIILLILSWHFDLLFNFDTRLLLLILSFLFQHLFFYLFDLFIDICHLVIDLLNSFLFVFLVKIIGLNIIIKQINIIDLSFLWLDRSIQVYLEAG